MKICYILILLFSSLLFSQTKLISHKSHSGTLANFNLKEDGNLGLPFTILALEENKDSAVISNLQSNERPLETIIKITTNEGDIVHSKLELQEYKKLRNKFFLKKDSIQEKTEFRNAWKKNKDSIINKLYDSISLKQKKSVIPFTGSTKPPKDKTPLLIGIISLVMIIMSILIWKIELRTQKPV